jgi:hypothetical protein
MKITVGQLRAIIREMAFERKSKKVANTFNRERLNRPPSEYYTPLDEEEVNRKFSSVQKYFSSKSWDLKADNVFKYVTAPIWVIPNFSLPESRTLRILSLEKALPSIEGSDFTVQEVKQHLAKGGCLLILDTSGVYENFWPTPWMSVHTIFDTPETSGEATGEFNLSTTVAVAEWLENITYELEENDLNFSIFQKILLKSMTMKSATNNEIPEDTPGDLASELLTQSVVLANGCKINQLTPELITEFELAPEEANFINLKLKELQDFVNSIDAKTLINDLFTGKIVQVEVIFEA